MAAVSRFVEFSVTAQTFATGSSTDTGPGLGTRGFWQGDDPTTDNFDIVLNSNDQLSITINGVGPGTITLASGSDLDPRFVARDIEYKIHNHGTHGTDEAWKFAQCQWRNGTAGNVTPAGDSNENRFIIWSGRLGNNGGTNDVDVASPGSRDARATLGLGGTGNNAGSDFATHGGGTYTGELTVSGVYGGQFDDFYTVMISDGELVDPAAGVGSPGFITSGGTVTTAGLYVDSTDTTYTITISTTNGSVMGAGTGNVPEMTWTATPVTDNSGAAVELLYPDHWYDLGTKGVRIKFSDATFSNGDQFTVDAFAASGTGYPKAVGSAKYIWDSWTGDSSKIHSIPAITTAAPANLQLGTRGVTIGFQNSGTLSLGDMFGVTCRGPQPSNVDTPAVTQLNFGNVTVSTNSPVKIVWFELVSGAVAMSTVKFSLQSDGTFQHHDQGDNDTEFHFGTVGAGNDAPGGGATSNSQFEFPVDADGLGNIAATDIDSDTPPNYLFATKQDLAVVSSADNAESIGNYQGALVSDFIYLAIELGANETGANSTINYRMFFDFS